MNADGSKKRNLTRSRTGDDFPVWSPDGRRIAFLRGRLHSTTVPGLGNTGHGRVLRFYSYHLYVMNADGSGQRRLTGKPAAAPFVWSPDGRTIYMGNYLVNVDASGAKRLAHIPRAAFGAQLVWSPDGRRIAFVVPHSPMRPGCCVWTDAEIHVMNADGSGHRKLTSGPGYDSAPAWSPDGRRIAFQSNRDGNIEIYVMNADGSGQRNLTRNAARDSRPSWSPDGRRIAFVSNRDGRLEAHVMNADGSGQRNLTLQAT